MWLTNLCLLSLQWSKNKFIIFIKLFVSFDRWYWLINWKLCCGVLFLSESVTWRTLIIVTYSSLHELCVGISIINMCILVENGRIIFLICHRYTLPCYFFTRFIHHLFKIVIIFRIKLSWRIRIWIKVHATCVFPLSFISTKYCLFFTFCYITIIWNIIFFRCFRGLLAFI